MKIAFAIIIIIFAQNVFSLSEQDTRLTNEFELKQFLIEYSQKSCAFNQNDYTQRIDVWSAQTLVGCLYSNELGPLSQRQKQWSAATAADRSKYIKGWIASCEHKTQMVCSNAYYITVFQSWLNADKIRVIDVPGSYQLNAQTKWYETLRNYVLSPFIDVDEENKFIVKPGTKAQIQVRFLNKVFFDKDSSTCIELIDPDQNSIYQRSNRCFELNNGVTNQLFDL